MLSRCGDAGLRAHGGCAETMPAAYTAARIRLTAPRGEVGVRMIEEETDETLMAAVIARRQQAFRILMSRHMPRAIRVAQRIVRDPAEADDIGQEAFLRVWSRASTFDPEIARFTTWLYRIVLNLAFDRVRKPTFASIEEAAEIRAEVPEPVDLMIADEQRLALERAMSQLSERHRAAVALFHMEGLSGEEAAKAMGLSAKAFESLLARARAVLREQVGKIQDSRRYT